MHILLTNSRYLLGILRQPVSKEVPRDGTVYRGTALRIGRSRVRLLMVSLEFFMDYGPGVDSASNQNEYQIYFLGDKGGQCAGLTTLPSSSVDSLEVWEPQPPGTL